jgi:hypothetical protein
MRINVSHTDSVVFRNYTVETQISDYQHVNSDLSDILVACGDTIISTVSAKNSTLHNISVVFTGIRLPANGYNDSCYVYFNNTGATSTLKGWTNSSWLFNFNASEHQSDWSSYAYNTLNWKYVNCSGRAAPSEQCLLQDTVASTNNSDFIFKARNFSYGIVEASVYTLDTYEGGDHGLKFKMGGTLSNSSSYYEAYYYPNAGNTRVFSLPEGSYSGTAYLSVGLPVWVRATSIVFPNNTIEHSIVSLASSSRNVSLVFNAPSKSSGYVGLAGYDTSRRKPIYHDARYKEWSPYTTVIASSPQEFELEITVNSPSPSSRFLLNTEHPINITVSGENVSNDSVYYRIGNSGAWLNLANESQANGTNVIYYAVHNFTSPGTFNLYFNASDTLGHTIVVSGGSVLVTVCIINPTGNTVLAISGVCSGDLGSTIGNITINDGVSIELRDAMLAFSGNNNTYKIHNFYVEGSLIVNNTRIKHPYVQNGWWLRSQRADNPVKIKNSFLSGLETAILNDFSSVSETIINATPRSRRGAFFLNKTNGVTFNGVDFHLNGTPSTSLIFPQQLIYVNISKNTTFLDISASAYASRALYLVYLISSNDTLIDGIRTYSQELGFSNGLIVNLPVYSYVQSAYGGKVSGLVVRNFDLLNVTTSLWQIFGQSIAGQDDVLIEDGISRDAYQHSIGANHNNLYYQGMRAQISNVTFKNITLIEGSYVASGIRYFPVYAQGYNLTSSNPIRYVDVYVLNRTSGRYMNLPFFNDTIFNHQMLFEWNYSPTIVYQNATLANPNITLNGGSNMLVSPINISNKILIRPIPRYDVVIRDETTEIASFDDKLINASNAKATYDIDLLNQNFSIVLGSPNGEQVFISPFNLSYLPAITNANGKGRVDRCDFYYEGAYQGANSTPIVLGSTNLFQIDIGSALGWKSYSVECEYLLYDGEVGELDEPGTFKARTKANITATLVSPNYTYLYEYNSTLDIPINVVKSEKVNFTYFISNDIGVLDSQGCRVFLNNASVLYLYNQTPIVTNATNTFFNYPFQSINQTSIFSSLFYLQCYAPNLMIPSGDYYRYLSLKNYLNASVSPGYPNAEFVESLPIDFSFETSTNKDLIEYCEIWANGSTPVQNVSTLLPNGENQIEVASLSPGNHSYNVTCSMSGQLITSSGTFVLGLPSAGYVPKYNMGDFFNISIDFVGFLMLMWQQLWPLIIVTVVAVIVRKWADRNNPKFAKWLNTYP